MMKPYLTTGEVKDVLADMANQIVGDYYPDGICTILSGALPTAIGLQQLFSGNNLHPWMGYLKLSRQKCQGYDGWWIQNHMSFFPCEVRGCRILIVDGIYDSGSTMDAAVMEMETRGAEEVRTATLLWRTGRNRPDYVGFDMKGELGYVVGFGMDVKERYRGLDAIYLEEAG